MTKNLVDLNGGGPIKAVSYQANGSCDEQLIFFVCLENLQSIRHFTFELERLDSCRFMV